ncbi:tellurite resistance TerB family protein [Pseudomonas nitroreducens]|uniref:Tellurite resistance TerB family protein n=1 Tax=Pseudomonas nitroreducens TaxID=46680 RepID=A0A5R9AHU7_PSENT|nr:tellurite resistance TerB family protein [Pseudomonas nitroreducens]TLP78322.1 tellurite resistance TerB family protein [Pseudomonas nitroreducens]
MNTTDLLEQLLRGSQGAATQQGGGAGGLGGLGGLLGGLLGGSSGGAGGGLGGLGDVLGGMLGGGMNSGGAPQGRTGSSGGINYAMLASLGMMAFQAYQNYQRQHPAAAPQQQSLMTVDQLSGPEAEAHSHAILRAMIAAAKADGRIDEKEKTAIQAEIARHTDEPELQDWLDAEVRKPLDAAEVAESAQGDPAVAAEMYLVSVMLVDDQQGTERTYLDELAYNLNLAPELQAHLEQQAKAGGEVA